MRWELYFMTRLKLLVTGCKFKVADYNLKVDHANARGAN